LVAALAVAAVVAAACSSSSKSSSGATSPPSTAAGASAAATGGTPVHIVVTGAVSASGTLGINSGMSVNAVKAAASVLNKNGGINGHPVDVTVVDDNGDPTTAVTKLQQALSSGSKPIAVLDSGPGNLAAAILPVLNQAKVLLFNIAPTADSSDATKWPLSFDLSPGLNDYSSAFCPAIQADGNKSVAIFYTDDAYGDALGPLVKTKCAGDNVSVTGIDKFDPTALDFTPQLQKLQGTHPDALILVGYGAPVGYILKNINKLGWNVPIYGDVAVTATPQVSAPAPGGLLGDPSEANLKMMVFKSTQYSASPPANEATMVNAIKAQGPIQATLVLAYDYDGVMLLAAAAKQANTVTDAAALAKALESLPPGTAQTGVLSAYHFSATSHAPNASPDEFAFVKPTKPVDGQFGAPGA
jgi:branched-chain amino acid transport system substrate-binding protein